MTRSVAVAHLRFMIARPALLVWVGLTLAPGCRDRTVNLATRTAAMADAASAAPDGQQLAAADATVDTSVGDASDGAERPDAGATDRVAVDRYVAFLRARSARRHGLWQTCFGAEPAYLTRADVPWVDPLLEEALLVGRAVFDPAAAQACLAAIEAMTCRDLIQGDSTSGGDWFTLPAFPSCAKVVNGIVPIGGLCWNAYECNGDAMLCGGPGGGCGLRCRESPRPARLSPGEACRADAICDGAYQCTTRQGLPGLWCEPRAATGPCTTQSDCTVGHHCAVTDPRMLGGECRPIAAGAPCAGSWDCGALFRCVNGACGRGKQDGEPCTVQAIGLNNMPQTDCGFGLECVDLGGGLRCTRASRLGEPCGSVPAGAGARTYLDCLEGMCDVKAGQTSVCEPNARTPGSACRADDDCDEPARCRRGLGGGNVCSVPDAGLGDGERCSFAGSGPPCGRGLYCAPNYPIGGAPPGIVQEGTCRPFLKVGESCADDFRCEPFAACILRRCVACAP